METLKLVYKGRDEWDRPVYECEGTVYVDVNPSGDSPYIHTKSNNEFDGEPDYPVGEDVEIIFIPERDRW